MKNFYVLSFLASTVILRSNFALAEGDQAEFFENRVRPLLAAKCQECHGREQQHASLRLDTKMGALSGGESGASVIAGQVDQSLLIQAIRREGLEMPPDEPLNEDEIAIFEKWVRDGAYWPTDPASMDAIALGDQEAIRKKGGEHWAFQPLKKPNVPSGTNAHPIDAFIDARLVEAKVEPLRAADKRTLIRRAYFDVIGLPPTAKAIEEFEKDERPEAFKDVVDGLLASKEYGQRWGRYWLDIARYADTRDWMAQTDVRYPFAYTYRDYVIQSLNNDKPYDEFIREQIAADLITKDEHAPELAALGFLTVGPRFRNDALEQIADRIDCISRGVMGLTVSCARCHDHKYDPVTIEDYYALFGVFDSTLLTDELPTIAVTRKLAADQVKAYEEAREAKVKERYDFVAGLRQTAIDAVCEKIANYLPAAFEIGVGDSLDIRGALVKYKVEDTGVTGLKDCLTDLQRVKKFATHPIYGPLHFGINLKDQDFANQFNAWLNKPEAQKTYQAKLVESLKQKTPQNRLQLIQAYAQVFEAALNSKADDDEESKAIVAALHEKNALLDFSHDSIIAGFRLLGGGRKKMGELETAIREVDVTHPGSPPRAMVLQEKDQPVTPFVLLRGEPGRRGERVPRRYISFFENGEPKPFAKSSSGRLELANKIVDPSNPLTARVAVNRVWMRYFGQGLVESTDDFGLRSNPPTHPELLDWLAASFIEHDWSMKWLHRTITTSATYQRSSVVPASQQAEAIDPDNELLWRQNRRRLDFEATRDTMLAVSGELDRSLDGPSIQLSSTPFPVRRSVYAYVDRVDMDAMLKVFDFASPLASSSRRAETTIPQHSLFVMNHPFVIERAQTIASKVRPSQPEPDLVNRSISTIFRRMLGRFPSAQERRAALDFVTAPVSTDGLKRLSPWLYGVWQTEEEGQGKFVELPHWTGQFYQGGTAFPDPRFGHARLTNTGGHPGREAPCVRRFIVPASGKASVKGALKHARDQGDGIEAQVVLRRTDGSQQMIGDAWRLFNSDAETTLEPFDVTAGDVLDFVVSSGKTSSSDAFNWTSEIAIEFDDESTTSWSSKDGFKPPPPALLDGWEQLAQALMLTNEFIYID